MISRMMPAGGGEPQSCPCDGGGVGAFACAWCGGDLRCTCHGATPERTGRPCGRNSAQKQARRPDLIRKAVNA